MSSQLRHAVEPEKVRETEKRVRGVGQTPLFSLRKMSKICQKWTVFGVLTEPPPSWKPEKAKEAEKIFPLLLLFHTQAPPLQSQQLAHALDRAANCLFAFIDEIERCIDLPAVLIGGALQSLFHAQCEDDLIERADRLR